MREVFERVVADPDLHAATMNLYHYSEFQGAEGVASLARRLETAHPELSEHLVRHAEDEYRHAAMIGDIMADWGVAPTPPGGIQYVDEFGALASAAAADPEILDEVEVVAALNATEKRGLFSFSLHVAALPKEGPAYRLLNQVKNEEAGHVRWGAEYIRNLRARGLDAAVAKAQAKFEKIEAAAYEASGDIMPGAPLRRMRRVLEIAEELPPERQVKYVVEQFLRAADPRGLAAARWRFVEIVWSSERLRAQVKDDVRRIVAGRPLGSDSVLGRLAEDAKRAVRALAATN
jgi:ferritin-like metal-binding protein YciE